MMQWWLLYVVIGGMATVVGVVTTPICRNLSWRLNFLDVPLGEFHKKHGNSTPLLGGVAMLTAWLVTVYGGLIYVSFFRNILPPQLVDQIPGIVSVLPVLLVITAGAVTLTVMGLIDDKQPMGPLIKFLLQLLICVSVTSYHKLRITVFVESTLLSWTITVCWYLFIINAFNFFDNMDGLASGTAFIACVLFTIVAAFRHQFFVAALGAATAGASLGFYLYNRYPASIFMGDSGSHFLGYMLAVISTLTMFYNPSDSPTAAPILIPALVLAVLIFDTFAVIVIRLRLGKPIYSGDHNHISHRFLHMGVSRKTAVLLVHLLTLAIGLGGLTLMWLDQRGVIIVLIQTIAILTLVSILHNIRTESNSSHDSTGKD